MKISSVRIKNFRALKDVTITFDAVTTFIGPNGTGKSTVLRALDWFFNGKPGSLNDKDCSFADKDEIIEVQVTFSELTEKDRVALGKYAPDGATTFTAWRQRRPDGSDVLSANAKSLPEFDPIKSANSATEKRRLYSQLRTDRPDLNLPQASTGAAVDQAVSEWEAANIETLSDAPEALQTNFFGFNSGGKMSGLFDYVLVTADLRASEESCDGRSSIIGRILERSIDRSSADADLTRIAEESRAKQQEVYDEKFRPQLEAMAESLNSVISSYSPGRAITISPAPVELKPSKATFELGIIDGVTETAIDRQGHGFQRTLLISALQLLAQSSAAAADGVICLAIEEPELFQHPIQAQTFAKVLRSLAEDPDKRIQVTYATHSPYFLESQSFHQIRRLTRSTGNPPVVTIHHATADYIKAKLAGIHGGEAVDRQLDNIVASQLTVALFSHRAFIVEGTTECSVFYGIGDRQAHGSLEATGVSIVPASGKTNIPLLHAILTSIGIPCYALFDADSGFAARAAATGKPDADIERLRLQHSSENRKILRYFNLPEEDFPSAAVTNNVAIFADHLESFLHDHWPEWLTACDEFEATSGISLKKNQAAYRIATLRADGEAPTELLAILEKSKGTT